MPFAADAHARPAYEYPVEAWLKDLDVHGIAYGVIAAATLFDDANAYSLAALNAYPDRLRATVILSPETDAGTLRALGERGVVGVRLVWRRLEIAPDLGSEPYRGFLRRIADSGMHVELLAGSATLPALLDTLVASGVAVVVDHLGAPASDPGDRQRGTDALLRGVHSGRVWIKLSAVFRMPMEIASEVASRLCASTGGEGLLWGSDAPFVHHESRVCYADTLETYRRLVPDVAVRQAIDRTALALYFNKG